MLFITKYLETFGLFDSHASILLLLPPGLVIICVGRRRGYLDDLPKDKMGLIEEKSATATDTVVQRRLAPLNVDWPPLQGCLQNWQMAGNGWVKNLSSL